MKSKNKVGRPRKLKPLINGGVPLDGAPIVKRGRGRPRKYPLPDLKPLILLSWLVWGGKRRQRTPRRRRTDWSSFRPLFPEHLSLGNSRLRLPGESGFLSLENYGFAPLELFKNPGLRPPEKSGFQSSENHGFVMPEQFKNFGLRPLPDISGFQSSENYGLVTPWEKSGFPSLGNFDPSPGSPNFKPVKDLDSQSDLSSLTSAAESTPSTCSGSYCSRDSELLACQWVIPGPIPDLAALMTDPAIFCRNFSMNVPDIGDWFETDFEDLG